MLARRMTETAKSSLDSCSSAKAFRRARDAAREPGGAQVLVGETRPELPAEAQIQDGGGEKNQRARGNRPDDEGVVHDAPVVLLVGPAFLFAEHRSKARGPLIGQQGLPVEVRKPTHGERHPRFGVLARAHQIGAVGNRPVRLNRHLSARGAVAPRVNVAPAPPGWPRARKLDGQRHVLGVDRPAFGHVAPHDLPDVVVCDDAVGDDVVHLEHHALARPPRKTYAASEVRSNDHAL